MKDLTKTNFFKNKKLLKIIGISLAVIATVGAMSSIMINAFMNVHDCKVSKTLYYDSTGHYYKCTENKYCNKKFQFKSHNLQWVVDKEETCEENGYKHRECDCGYKINVGTVIDDFYYDKYLRFDTDIQYLSYNNFFETGDYSDSLSLNNCMPSSNSMGNTCSFALQSVYELSTRTADNNYVTGNVKNNTLFNVVTGVKLKTLDNEISIQLRTFGQEPKNHSLDIVIDNDVRYRLINDEVNALCEDFLKTNVLIFDIGAYHLSTQEHIIGFKFKTANKELVYLSSNAGLNIDNVNIDGNTKFFGCKDINSLSGNEFTIDDILVSFLKLALEHYKSQTDPLLQITANSHTGSVNFGTLVSSNGFSNWFANRVKYIEWKNS